jgi:hypothetical protein
MQEVFGVHVEEDRRAKYGKNKAQVKANMGRFYVSAGTHACAHCAADQMRTALGPL